MQRKERDELRLSPAVPKISRTLTPPPPTAPTAIRLWETFTLLIRFTVRVFCDLSCVRVCVRVCVFSFIFEGGMRDLIVLIPDHFLSFY